MSVGLPRLGSLFSVVFAGFVAVGLSSAALPSSAVEVGQPAPPLDLAGVKGLQRLSDLKDKVVYLDFWASWCGPCRQSFPWMNEMQRKYGSQGLQIVAVNVDANRADADKFLAQLPAQFAVVFDAKGESAKTFRVQGMPTSVLIGRGGKVLATHRGFREEDRKELESSLSAALVEKTN